MGSLSPTHHPPTKGGWGANDAHPMDLTLKRVEVGAEVIKWASKTNLG